MEGFVVRKATCIDLKSTFLDFSIKEGWKFGKYDLDFFFDVDDTGFYIGELNGTPVSCVSVVKYGNKFASLGFYVVAKKYRGQSFGLKTFQTAMASLDDEYTCSLYCLQHMIPTYQLSGFTISESLIKTYETTPLVALQGLQSIYDAGVIIKPVSEVSFDKVSQYDSSVFGAPHDKYLKGLLSMPEQYGFVAIDKEQDNVVGLVVVRKALLDDGWIIAPLFGNTSDIAKSLLKTTFELMVLEAIQDDKVTLDMEVGFNPCCTEVTSCLVGKFLPFNVTTMYTKGPPLGMKKEVIYVINSTAVG